MIFCSKCGSILRPKEKAGKKILWCSCGFTTALEEAKPTEETNEKAPEVKKIEIVEEIEVHPKIKAECEKCGNKEAYYWTQQTRGADEPETRFFKCTKCSYTWREYS
jgi:DNA-directed RNA polymerase subunit M